MELSEILQYKRDTPVYSKKSLLSQNAFAEVLGVSFSTINRWESGKAVPQISMLKQINEFCLTNNIPVDVTNVVCDKNLQDIIADNRTIQKGARVYAKEEHN